MAELPAPVNQLCYSLGVDPHSPNWSSTIAEYCTANPSIYSGDPVALSTLRDYVTAQQQEYQQQQPVDGPSPATIEQLLETFNRLGQSLHSAFGARPATPERQESVKIADPPKFSGEDRALLKPFIAHVSLKVATEASKFRTEKSKVAYALSNLTGLAFKLYEAEIVQGLDNPHRPSYLATLQNLFNHLDTNFGDRGAENAALRELTQLKQGNSAAYAYYSRFNSLTPHLGWGGTAFRDHFYQGLRDDVKDELSKATLPATLPELATRAIEIDNRFYERRKERQASSHRPSHGTPARDSRPSTTTGALGARPRAHSSPPAFRQGNAPVETEAMEVDAVSAPKKLTPAEKERRRKANLCLYCGRAGHYTGTCPAKGRIPGGHRDAQPNSRYRVSDVTYTISSPNEPPSDSILSPEN